MNGIHLTYKRFVIYTSSIATFIGLMSICGWLINFNILKHTISGHIEMKFNTAVCIVLLGTALLLRPKNNQSGRHVIKALALLVVGFSALTLFQDIFINFSVDDLFIPEDPVKNVSGRINPLTALFLIITGLAIFFNCTDSKRCKHVMQYQLHLVTIVCGVILIGHLFDVPQFYMFNFITTMPFSTALALVALSSATTILNPSYGVVSLFTGKMIGNYMARKLSMKMFFSILLLGYLHNLDHRYNWLSPQLGSVLLTVSFMAITLILIWESCTAINRIDHKKNIARENFRLGVESSPYALILSDANDKIIHANVQTERLYGYTRKELAGQSLELIIPENSLTLYHEKKQDNNKVVALGIEEDIFAVRKDGTQFPVEIVLTPVKTIEGAVVMASIFDISLRKQQENIIRDQVIELQVKNQELEHVTYIASHDLQEPLRTVSNYITLLEEDYPDQINGEIKQHLGTMQAATTRMSLLIRSFLDYGKLGRNRKFGPTNCNDVVNNVVADLNNLIKCSNATITIATKLPLLYAYETELRLLFQNLINNAIKFRKKDVAPQITVGCKELDGFFEFYVSDNGIGISCKDKDVIFHIFKRVKTEEEYEGHGIGLANCKKIADIHGGKIWVEPGTESGSTFKFTILNFKT